MGKCTAVIDWNRDDAEFEGGRYSRAHRWSFDGGVEVPASSSPQVVPLPYSLSAAVDPEEAFVASLSSCHMLWFLSLACQQGFVIDAYRDEASGFLARDAYDQFAMTIVTLHPEARFGARRQPGAAEVLALRRDAHERCFIARSVKTEVRCEPVGLDLPASEAAP